MSNRIFACGIFIVAIAFFPSLSCAQLTIEPSLPKALEAIWLRVPASAVDGQYIPGSHEVSMSANRIAVSLRVPTATFPVMPPMPSVDIELGRFPAGTYQVEFSKKSESGIPFGPVTTLGVTVSDDAANNENPLGNFTDLWWDPVESGWGLSINHHVSNIIFAVWFVYSADGKPTWYFMSNARQASHTSYTGSVYKTTGPYFGGVFNPAAVVVTPAGTATLVFSHYDRGTFSYTIDGVTGTKNIQRQGF